MNNEPEGNDMQKLWQAQAIDAPRISAEYVRHRMLDLGRRIKLRNAFDYVVGGAGVMVFAWFVWLFKAPAPIPLLRVGVALCIPAALFVFYRWHQLAAATESPAEAGVLDAITFYRRQLERQRDARRNYWRWYWLPWLPGMIVIYAGLFLEFRPIPWTKIGFTAAWAVFGTCAVVLGFRKDARRLQEEIDALDSMAPKDRI
jgi:hypothetical protein